MSTRTISPSGGTRNWNDTLSWLEGAVPVNGDDVRAFAPSGNIIVNVDTANLNSFDLMGYTATISGTQAITVAPGTLGPSVDCRFWGTITWNGALQLNPAAGYTVNLTTHGAVPGTCTLLTNGIVQQQDPLTTNTSFWWNVTGGTWYTNGFPVSTGSFSGSSAILHFSSSTITVGRDFYGATWSVSGGILDSASSTIVLSYTGSSATTFAGGGMNYNNVTVTGSGTGALTVTGTPNTFNSFTVNPPKTALFAHGSVQIVTNFVAPGTASNIITIQSDLLGSFFTLSKSSGTVSVSYCSIRDSHISGGATWNAHISTNVSGNVGWTFVPFKTISPSGGTRNWNDTLSWVTGQVPVNGDDVVVTNTSGNINVNTTTAYLNSLDLIGYTATFSGSSFIYVRPASGTTSIVRFAGTVTWSSFLELDTLNPGDTSTVNLYLNNKTLYMLMIGNNVNGNIIVNQQDALTLNQEVYLKYGTWNTNNYDVNIGWIEADFSTPTAVNLGSSNVTLTAQYGFYYSGHNLTLNAGTSTINCSYAGVNNIDFKGNGSTFYNVIFSGAGNRNVLISGSNAFTSLSLTPPKTVVFTHGTTQTVPSLTASGLNSSNIITFKSDSPGSFASLTQSSGTKNLNYISLQDIHVTGGTWNAGPNYTDVSGNLGWTFVERYFKKIGTITKASIKNIASKSIASIKKVAHNLNS